MVQFVYRVRTKYMIFNKKQKVECYQIIIWFVKCDVFDQFDKEKWQGTVNPWNNIYKKWPWNYCEKGTET